MGYLTPILIRNDSAHMLRDGKLQKQICKKLYYATVEYEASSISINYPGGGVNINPIETLGTAHADVRRVIVISGNDWIDLSREAYKYDVEPTEYLRECLRIAERDVKTLKKRIKMSDLHKKQALDKS